SCYRKDRVGTGLRPVRAEQGSLVLDVGSLNLVLLAEGETPSRQPAEPALSEVEGMPALPAELRARPGRVGDPCPHIVLLSAGLNHYRRAVSQHFRDTLHHFGGIVARSDHRVSAELSGVLQHEVESFGTGLLTQLGQKSDIAAENGLQAGPDSPENRAGAHHNAAHYAQRAHHAKTVELELRGHHVVGNHSSGRTVAWGHRVHPSSWKLSCRFAVTITIPAAL